MGDPLVRLCVPVTEGCDVFPKWCRADRIALADVRSGRIVAWRELRVGWAAAHGESSEDEHHARMATFLHEQAVDIVVVDHMGTCLRGALLRMQIAVHQGAAGPAREAVLDALHRQLVG